jgi:hypothetical protein
MMRRAVDAFKSCSDRHEPRGNLADRRHLRLSRPGVKQRPCLAERVATWQATSAPQNLRFVWIEAPNAAPDVWRTNSIRIDKPQALGGTVASAARITFAQYATAWAQGCTVTLDESMLGFALATPDASLSGAGA